VASLSQGRTAAAQCGLFTHKSVPVIFEPPCIILYFDSSAQTWKVCVLSMHVLLIVLLLLLLLLLSWSIYAA